MLRIEGWRRAWSTVALAAMLLVGCGSAVPVDGFRVAIGPAGAYAPRSQAAVFQVTVQREAGYSESVEVTLRSAAVGITAAGAVAAGADRGELLVTVGPDAPLGPVVLQLVATGRAATGAPMRQDVDFVVTVLDGSRPTLHLVEAAGSPPPATVHEELVVPDGADPWRLELVVLGGALLLDPDGSYQHQLTIDTLQDGRLVGRSRWADHGAWGESERGLAFTSAWIQGHGFTGTRRDRDVAIAFDLRRFVGSHAVVELVFEE